MKREFLIDRSGRQFVLFAGLLDLAHEKGLTNIVTEVVSITATLALFKATVMFADGRVFTEHGDATPENVGRNIAPHFIRMAETRAKARALRDALNIGAASLEELGDDDAPSAPARPAQPAPRPQSRPAEAPQQVAAVRPTSAPAAGGDLATPVQVRAVYLLGRDKQGMDEAAVDARAVELYGSRPAELSRKQASGLITAFQGGQGTVTS